MDKLKSIFKIVATNKMAWIAFVIGMLIVMATAVTVGAISNEQAKKQLLSNAKPEETEESKEIIKQEELTDTSKLSAEELKKLKDRKSVV